MISSMRDKKIFVGKHQCGNLKILRYILRVISIIPTVSSALNFHFFLIPKPKDPGRVGL